MKPIYSQFLGFLLLCQLSTGSANAQLTPDSTLGAESSTVTPEATRQLIQGGATRGSNLFHSFTDFNVNENQRVDFANPAEISNIFTRVTGGNISNIFGTLGVEGAANLFLLNPNGIIFGPNAQLDIRGSFVATTAESLLFENNMSFSASNPQAPPLLTVNVPIGLQYGSNSTATISNRGNLSVGGNFELGATNLELEGQLRAGGDLTLQATDTLQIRDSETSPFIAATNGKLLVQGNEKVDIFALNHPDSGLYSGGDMVLRSGNRVGGDAHYWSGRNFRIEDLQGNLGDLYSPYDPIIRSLGDVSFQGYVGSSLHIFAAGSVTIPVGIRITGPDPVNGLVETVMLSDGSSLKIDGKTRPTLDIRAGMNPTAVGTPFLNPADFYPFTPDYIFPNPPTLTGAPTRADINIETVILREPNGQVFLTNQYEPNALPGDIIVGDWISTTSLTGNSGDVRIDARGNLTLKGEAEIDTRTIGSAPAGNIDIIAGDLVEIFSTPASNLLYLSALIAGTWGSGNAGNIEVKAKRVSVRDGGFIYTRSHNSGRAGDITILADESVELRGAPSYNHESGLFASALGDGDAGNIRIETGHLLVQEGAQISTENNAPSLGAAGNITIAANESVEVTGVPPYAGGKPTGIYTFTGNNKPGGDIKIDTRRFIVRDGGSVSTGTDAAGDGGDLIVNASDYVLVAGASAFDPDRVSRIRAITTSSGNGGNLTINTGKLLVENGGLVSANSSNMGNSGTLTVNASDLVRVTGNSPNGQTRSQLFFDSSGWGNAGQLRITTGSLQVLEGGKVSAATSGSGQGGLLEVNATNGVAVLGASNNGQFVSSLVFDSSGSGNAGELRINTGRLLVGDGGKVSAATSSTGQAGLLEVNTSDYLAVIGTSPDGRNRSQLFFDSTGAGNAGQLRIDARWLLVGNGGLVSAATSNSGQGGVLDVNTANFLAIIGNSSDGQFASSLLFDSRGTGNAGQLNIDTGALFVVAGGLVSATTSDAGRGGILNVNAWDSVQVSGTSDNGQFASSLLFDSRGTGDAGQLNINTGQLLVRDGGLVSATTSDAGRGGLLNVNAWDSVQVSGTSNSGQLASSLLFDSRGTGDAGQLNINTGQLLVRDGGLVSATTSDVGRGGLLNVNARDSIKIVGTSIDGQLASRLSFDSKGRGDAGQLRLSTAQLLIQNGGRVSAATSSTGQAGLLDVNASDSVQVVGISPDGQSRSQLFFDSTGAGNAGRLNIKTTSLLVQEGGLVSAETSHTGQGGVLDVNASDSVKVIGRSSNGQFTSSVLLDSSGTGDAGELKINTGQLLIEDGGKVSAGTSGAGRGGILEVNAANSVRVSGAGSRLYFDSTGAGNARGIRINTGDLQVENGGEITVNGTGTGLAGDLDITASSIALNQQGNLLARTVSGEGGNIRLNVADNVLLRFNSNILTEALGPGNGGNITIDAGGFVLAVLPENSDVAATAIQGRGGNIFVTAKGVLGFSLPERLVRTPESDISAASELGIDGTTTINARNVPTGVPLPDRVGTPTIDSSCQANRELKENDTANSQFFVTGRGGLSPHPADILSSSSVEVPWLAGGEEENLTAEREVQEAKGWAQLADGRILLTSEPSPILQGTCSGFIVRTD